MIGTKLGHYEIVSHLGSGGMGDVYRARDSKLNREVAVKVLLPAVANDPERLARFEREAKTLASLNHPNIGSIHGLEETNGVTALILELVEGPTLADRIAQGPIPIDEALGIARQIATALEAAHDQGIIHRDLKPANVKVRVDGAVKVLDFGLAKAFDHAPDSSSSTSPTISMLATQAGIILGTAAYMSPEQARGKLVDQRADIWAFGCVLFEMLTGQRAFVGEDVTDTLAAVVRGEPDWTLLPQELSPTLIVFLRRSLHKDPRQRLGDIRDIRMAMDGAFDLPAATAAAAAPRSRWRPTLPWALGAFIVGGLAGWAVIRSLAEMPPARIERFGITTPANASPTTQGANNSALAISPDGSRVVYRSTRGGPNSTDAGVLYVRDRGQFEPTLLRGTETAVGPVFSPDGEWIAFGAGDNTLKRVSLQGGAAQTICALDGPLRGASWGVDDTIVFATSNSKGLRRVPISGGEPKALTRVDSAKGESDHFWPEMLPDGNGVLFTMWGGLADRSHVAVLSLSDNQVTTLISGGTYPRFARTGHVVFAVGNTLRAVQFDPTRLATVGNPIPVMEGVGGTVSGAAHYAIGSDGTLVYVNGEAGGDLGLRTLVWVDRQGRESPINVPPRPYTYARLSPDGTKIALDARDHENDIWIWDLERETLQRLTTNPGMDRGPVWTHDGKRVAFTAQRQDQPESIYWQASDGSGTPERLSVSSMIQFASSFSPDGKRLVFHTPSTPPYDLGVLNLDGERREEIMLLKTSLSETNGALSPDGRWLAYQSNESGRDEIYLTPFPDVNTSKRPVSTGGGTRPLWSKNGSELFYHIAPATIIAVPITPGPDIRLGKPTVVVKGTYAIAVNNARHYDVSPDGKRFLMLKSVEENAPERQPARPEMRLVLHWFDELNRLVPIK